MALKTGIVGMPNVGKASADMLQHAHIGMCLYRGIMCSLEVTTFECQLMQHVNTFDELAVNLVQCHLQKRKSTSSKFSILHH